MINRVAPLVLAVALVACAPSVPAASSARSALSSASPPATTSSPTTSPPSNAATTPGQPPAPSSPAVSPAGSPSADRYSRGDIVAVSGDGLAVRQGPGTAYALLGAARWGEDGVEVLGSPYRLSAGDHLVIGQGPLVIDGRDWYEAVDAGHVIQWIASDDPDTGLQGWIAATDGDTEFVRLVTDASDVCCFLASGVGPATTATITLPDSPSAGTRGIVLTVGHADPDGSCQVRVTDDTDQVLLDQTIVGWDNPSAWWPGEGDRLVIETDCSWSLNVGVWVG